MGCGKRKPHGRRWHPPFCPPLPNSDLVSLSTIVALQPGHFPSNTASLKEHVPKHETAQALPPLRDLKCSLTSPPMGYSVSRSLGVMLASGVWRAGVMSKFRAIMQMSMRRSVMARLHERQW